MAVQPDPAFGLAITFSSGVFTAALRDVTLEGFGERDALETTVHDTTNGWRTFMPSDLRNAGGLTADLLFDVSKLSGYKTMCTSTAETITMRLATQGTSASTNPQIACLGFCTAFTAAFPLADLMSGTVTLKFTGEPTMTNGSTV